jgi:hypothetical protein
MMTAETGEPERDQWIANLDEVAALSPAVVVAGHKQVNNDNDPKIIAESRQYLRDFTWIAAEETTTAGIVARMTERYPDWETSAPSGTPPDPPSHGRTASGRQVDSPAGSRCVPCRAA